MEIQFPWRLAAAASLSERARVAAALPSPPAARRPQLWRFAAEFLPFLHAGDGLPMFSVCGPVCAAALLWLLKCACWDDDEEEWDRVARRERAAKKAELDKKIKAKQQQLDQIKGEAAAAAAAAAAEGGGEGEAGEEKNAEKED